MLRSSRTVNFGLLLLTSLPCCAAALDAPLRQHMIDVGTAGELESAVIAANRSGGHVTITLARGVYTLSHTLNVLAPHVTLAGSPGQRANVIVQGDAMSPSAGVGNLIRVSGAYFTLRDITLRRTRWHLIQIAGEDGAEAPVIRDCVLEDSYEQMLKVSLHAANPQATSDGGLVENCVFAYTAGIGPEFYVGGIDAHGAKHWTVRNNVFRDISSPSHSVAEFAVHFWDGSADDLIERNLIIDCDRGIGFGLRGKPNQRGIIRNNMIYHAPGVGRFADVGIALADSPGSRVYANTILLESDYPRAIEYRFLATRDVLIANNLTNREIVSQNGATGLVSHNVTDADADWFVSASTSDLRLAHAVPGVTRAGLPMPDLKTDFHGRSRPSDQAPDIGADQGNARDWSPPI